MGASGLMGQEAEFFKIFGVRNNYSSKPLQLSLLAHTGNRGMNGFSARVNQLAGLWSMRNGYKMPKLNKPQVVGADDLLVDARSVRMWNSVQALATITQAKKVNYEISSYQLVKSPVLLMMLINFTIDESLNPNFTAYTFFDLLGFL